MKKMCCFMIIVLILIFALYIMLMSMFEGPICIDLTDDVQLSVVDQSLKLPWYLRLGIEYECKFNGLDSTGRKYTLFGYTLPKVFETSELNCVVCWDTKEVKAFIGEPRAMFAIDTAFPTVQWN